MRRSKLAPNLRHVDALPGGIVAPDGHHLDTGLGRAEFNSIQFKRNKCWPTFVSLPARSALGSQGQLGMMQR